MTTRAWRLPSSEVRSLRILEHLHGASTTWVEDLDDLGVERDDVWAVLRDLELSDQVELQPRHVMSMGQAYPGARLTSTGTAYVEVLREKRTDPVARARACRTEILLWLYATEDHMPVTTNFLKQAPAPTFYGDLFTEKDTMAAAGHLRELELINGQPGWGSTGAPLRTAITADGRRCVEDNDADPTQPRHSTQPSSVYVQHNYQSSGSIAQGEHAVAVTHHGLQADDIERLHKMFTDGLQSLDNPDDREEAEQAIEDLIGDLRGDHIDTERVQRRVRALDRISARIGNAALTAAASEGGKRVMELLANTL